MTLADLQLLAAAVLIFVPLERLLPLHRDQDALRPGLRVDILHLFVSGFLIRTGATATAIILSFGAGSVVPVAVHDVVRSQPVLIQFIELLFLSDLCFYIAHRTVHAVPWLWRFHMVHHSSERLDWLATYRVHPLDQIFNSTIIALPAIALGFAPLALLVYAFLYRWHSMLLHSNVKVNLGPLGLFLATPRFHHWHHANEAQAFNKNFGGQLVIWDRLFGTACEELALPAQYGSGGVPETYVGQLYSPFVDIAPSSSIDAVQSSFVSALARDAGIYLFIVAYLAACAATSILIGTPQKFQPLMYSAKWIEFLAYGIAAAVVWTGARSLLSNEPLREFRQRLAPIFSAETSANVTMILALSVFASVFTSFKTMLTNLEPFTADPVLAALDSSLHGGDPWRALPMIPGVTYVVEKLYFPGWTFLLIASIATAVLMPRFRPIRAQYLWTYVVTWSLLGNVVAAMVMSGGPIFYQQLTGSDRFAELTTYLAAHAPMTSQVRDWLWINYQSGVAGTAAGISAFPSLHLAMACLFALQARRYDGRLGLALAVFCAVMLAGSVHLGWHYAIDGYFSIAATLLIWSTVGWCLGASKRRNQASPNAFGPIASLNIPPGREARG